MAEQIMWKAQAVIESEGKKLLIHAAGPAENIYIALGHAKACIAKEYPKIDPGKIKINYYVLAIDADLWDSWKIAGTAEEVTEQ